MADFLASAGDASDARQTDVRTVAIRQLQRIEAEGAFVGLVAEEGDEALDAREGRQVTEYVAGVTRQRRWLDFLLGRFYRGDLGAMEPLLRQVLRVGLYDLLFLGTPPHAALNEAVERAKRLVRPGAGGLVNGILRSVLRSTSALPEPDTGDVAEDLAIRYSHPSWIVRRWAARYGPEETRALLAWNNERPVFGLRVNTLRLPPAGLHRRLDETGVEWTPSDYLDDFVRLPRLQPVLREGLLSEGIAAVQDEAAGLVVRVLDPQPGETVLDGCAAPGGKALYAAERMQNRGRVVAVDIHPGRLHLATRVAVRHGITCLETTAADLRALAGQGEHVQADRVLLDAPCSGLGVLAKRADLRWNRTPEALAELTRLQAALLDAAAAFVRPGGLLVYSTCTIEPEENEAQVEAFLARRPDFTVEPATGLVPPALVTPGGFYATLPHRHHVDGAFAARLRRR